MDSGFFYGRYKMDNNPNLICICGAVQGWLLIVVFKFSRKRKRINSLDFIGGKEEITEANSIGYCLLSFGDF